MNKSAMLLTLTLLTACASEPVSTPSQPVAVPAQEAKVGKVEKSEDDSASRVLNKNKKCPKNTKMVNGKCLLQVETTE